MTNVLPPEARKSVWHMYRARFILAGALVGLAVAFFSFVALSPSYLILRMNGTTPISQDKADSDTVAQDRSAILEAQSLITALTPLLNASTSKAELIAEALALRPAGISINHITLTSGAPGTMILAGSAKNISAINTYRKVLEGEKHFSAVSVPVGDLAGTQNGQFSITLTGIF